MELSPEQLKDIRVDSILVKTLLQPETRRGLYVPDSARRALDKKRGSTWEGKIIRFGAEIDKKQWEPHTVSEGDTVVIAPEAIDCPSFFFRNGEELERFVFVRDEDILAKRN